MRAHDRQARVLLLLALLTTCACAGGRTSTVRQAAGQGSSAGGHVNGLRDGPWTEFWANGRKQSEGSYENDVQAGVWTYWFENGNKEMEGRFTNERRDGEWTSWYEDGALRARGRFERGFEEGLWRFHSSSGALEHEGNFELGQPILRWTYFHPDGTARATGNYLAGVKVGEWTEQAAAGTRTVIAYPVPAGFELVEESFADGTLKRSGFLRDGLPAGRWITHHPGGEPRLECSFSDGAPNGRAWAWHADGSLLALGTLKNGCLHGSWVFTRGATEERIEFKEARPRQTFAGEWSPASSADRPGSMVVETWVAEMCSPRQPAALRSVSVPGASPPALALGGVSGIPARAQPWTEYESSALSALVKLYGSGKRSPRDEEDWQTPVARGPLFERGEAAANLPDLTDFIGRALPVKRFTTADGDALDLDDYVGKKNVLVTILRGFGGQVCVYCTAQTRGLADFATEFAAHDTEVVVIYPGPASGLEAFLEAYRRTFGPGEKLPYKLLYDTDLALTRALRIEDNIAVPTSLVLDRKGILRWGHVAKDHADRPSARAVLDRIEALPKDRR